MKEILGVDIGGTFTDVVLEIGAEHVGWIQSLISTCVLQNVDPYTYLVDVLQRVDPSGRWLASYDVDRSRIVMNALDGKASSFRVAPPKGTTRPASQRRRPGRWSSKHCRVADGIQKFLRPTSVPKAAWSAWITRTTCSRCSVFSPRSSSAEIFTKQTFHHI